MDPGIARSARERLVQAPDEWLVFARVADERPSK
jgi:hypothetical protein